MGEKPCRLPEVPGPLVVRLARSEERVHWRQLMDAYHYLGFQPIVGQSLWYVATVDDQWVALWGWGAAALKCRPRDAWIGWTPSLQWRRLHLIANHVRFLILPQWHRPNGASRILALNLKRLSQDWKHYYGHPILLVETFVDAARFRGRVIERPAGRFSALPGVLANAGAVTWLTVKLKHCWFVL